MLSGRSSVLSPHLKLSKREAIMSKKTIVSGVAE